MNINKQALIDAAKQGIEQQENAQAEYDRLLEDAKANWERVWREEIRPKWEALAKEIIKGTKTGAPITRAMMPEFNTATRGYSSDVQYYQPFNSGRKVYERWQDATHDLGPRPVFAVQSLKNLLRFLEAVSDETVTVASLERVGFKNLAKLMNAVNTGYWEV